MAPTIGLALGGGGARGFAHVHALEALDDLGVRPTVIAGSSIGAIMGAAFAAGMSGAEIRDFVAEVLSKKRTVVGRLWRNRPATLSALRADGGFRLGQLSAERVLSALLPETMPHEFEALDIPLVVMATDFYGCRECAIETGPLRSALAASAALPAIFRPVMRDAILLVDGGICNPLPFDRIEGRADLIVAVDVTGGPHGDPGHVPGTVEATLGASQLMMLSIIEAKLKVSRPDLLLRPAVSKYRVVDFLHHRAILEGTAPLREEMKRALGDRLEAHERGAA